MDTKANERNEKKPRVVSEPAITYYQDTSDVYVLNDEELASILLAEEQLKRGEYITQKEMDKHVKEWLKRK